MQKTPEINVLNKYARYKITVVFRTKTNPGLYRPMGGQSGSLQNWLGGGGGGTTCTYIYKQHSIENIGSVKMSMRTLTDDNRYSGLNGHFVRQTRPSSLEREYLLKNVRKTQDRTSLKTMYGYKTYRK